MTSKTALRTFARTYNFEAVAQHGEEGVQFVRGMSGQFRECFKHLDNAALLAAIKADLPKLAAIHREWWPSLYRATA